MDLSELERLESPAKVLKLSEAIRLGAKIRPQIRSGVYSDGIGSCAIGAAYEAYTGKLARSTMPGDWHNAMIVRASMAYSKKYKSYIFEDNDSGMTREAIADRLEAMGY